MSSILYIDIYKLNFTLTNILPLRGNTNPDEAVALLLASFLLMRSAGTLQSMGGRVESLPSISLGFKSAR